MDRYTMISALAAAAIHGGILFGWPRGKIPARTPVQVIDCVFACPLIPPEDYDPPVATDCVVHVPTGRPKIITDESPVRVAVADFPIPAAPRLPVSVPRSEFLLNPPLETPRRDENYRNVQILPAELLDSPPRVREQVAPIHSYRTETRDRVTVTMRVEFTVDEAGRVLDPRIVETTNPGFNEATLQAVSKWRFEPGTRQGKPVRFRMVVPIIVNLD